MKTVYTIIKKASKIPADIVRYTFLARDAAYILANKPVSPEIGTPCDLCNKPGTDRFPTLRFDHDHDSLKHRGWLCDTCNRSLGPLGDNVVSMVNIINYMTENI